MKKRAPHPFAENPLAPDMPGVIEREIHEHEVLLVFNDDWEAHAFREWVDFGAFAKWAHEHRGDYE